MDFDSASFTIATPIPGSELYSRAKEKGWLREDFSFNHINYRFAELKNPEYGPGELEAIIAKATYQFNMSHIKRHPLKFLRKYGLFALRRPKEIFRMFKQVT